MLMLVLFIELTLLFFLSRTVTQHVFEFFMLLFRVRSVAVSLLLAIQFPGTVIHELAHLFTAEILGVKTGKLRLEPESIREDSIQAGSVMVAESDPFRRYAIGLAPLVWGISALTLLSYIIPSLYTSVFSSGLPMLEHRDLYYLLGVGYLLYAISNTMFPSPEDTKGIFPFLIAVVALFVFGYLFGVRLPLSGEVVDLSTQLITTLAKSIGIVLGLNTMILILTGIGSSLISRIFHIQIRK